MYSIVYVIELVYVSSMFVVYNLLSYIAHTLILIMSNAYSYPYTHIYTVTHPCTLSIQYDSREPATIL